MSSVYASPMDMESEEGAIYISGFIPRAKTSKKGNLIQARVRVGEKRYGVAADPSKMPIEECLLFVIDACAHSAWFIDVIGHDDFDKSNAADMPEGVRFPGLSGVKVVFI